MTLNQIKYFITVATYLNFTRAAASLFISQPALSRSISALEQELSVRLLDRDFHSVKLTAAGEVFYHEMSEVMKSVDKVLAKVCAMDSEHGRFVIGLLDGQSVDPKVLSGLQKLSDYYPDVNIELRRGCHSELVEGLINGNIDVAQSVISSRTVLDVNLTSFTLREVPYLLVARKDSQIWREQITLSGLRNTAVLFQQDITPDLLDVVKIVSKSENKLRIKYAPDTATLSLWLEAGIGVTICNQNGIVCTSNTRPLKHIELEELGFAKMVLLWNKNSNGILLESFWKVVKHL